MTKGRTRKSMGKKKKFPTTFLKHCPTASYKNVIGNFLFGPIFDNFWMDFWKDMGTSVLVFFANHEKLRCLRI